MFKDYYLKLEGKRALVTGASSGIGFKTACFLAEQDCHVIAAARRLEKLNELKSLYPERITPVSKDLNLSSSLEEMGDRGFFDVDILVNNAGLALGKDLFEASSDSDIETMVQTNLLTALKIAKKCLHHMKKNKIGDIVNIASIASHEAYKGGVVYAATKHALLASSKALREETYGENIRIMTVSPGMVETEFSNVRFKGDLKKAKATYEGFNPLTSKDVAVQILNALRCPRHVNIDEILILSSDQAGATKVKRTFK